MTFLNWIMLIGLAGVSVPIIIHLLNRRRARRVPWGAMRFLLEAMASQNRRILIEELILLILRCLFVALLVLALARPFLPSRTNIPWMIVLPAALGGLVLLVLAVGMWSFHRVRPWLLGAGTLLLVLAGVFAVAEQWLQNRRWASGKGAKDVVVLLDASTSMSLAVDGRPTFEHALEEARAAIDACRPSDAVNVLLAAQSPRPLLPNLTTDHEKVLAALDDVQEPAGGAMHVLANLNAAAEMLQQGGNAGKRIVVVTDGQALGWDTSAESRWRYLSQQLGELPAGAEVVVRPLSVPESYNNVALADIRPLRDVVGTDRPVGLEVRVANTGTSPMTPRSVKLNVDGGEVLTQSIGDIPVGAEATARFDVSFDEAGRHVLAAYVDCDDDLAGDNRAQRVLDVVDRLKVLVVDGAPSPYRHDSPADYISLALTPVEAAARPAASGGAEVPDDVLVHTDVVAAPDVAGVKRLDPYSVVVLANVPRLPDEFANALVSFVEQGGGLLIAPGDRAQLNGADGDEVVTFYNDWQASSGQLVCPARLEERVVRPVEPVRLDLESMRHPALAKVAQPRSDLGDTLVYSYWRLDPATEDPDVRVAGRLATGSPFLAERRLGHGYVLMTAMSLDSQDSNLPQGHASFVLLMHELIYFQATPSVGDANVKPGEEFSMDLSRRNEAGGLRAEYYRKDNFRDLALRRIDPRINFEWGDGSPAPGIGDDHFSVRWTGRLRPKTSGRHRVYYWADDGIRIWIDGKKHVDRWDYRHEEMHFDVDLQAGASVPIRIDFAEQGGVAGIRLAWSAKGLDKQIIPPDALLPEATSPYEAVLAATKGLDALSVETPSGRLVHARLERENSAVRLRCSEAFEPGLYKIRVPEALRGYLIESRGDRDALPFVVVADANEGDLTALEAEALTGPRRWLGDEEVGLLLARSTDELTASISGAIPGDEVWQVLAVVALLVLLSEVALQRWIAMKRRIDAAESVDIGDQAIDVLAFREGLRQKVATSPESQPASEPVGRS